MTKSLCFMALAILLSSCANKLLVYDYHMSHPVESKNMFYENDKFSITFKVENQDIAFTVFNKMDEGIRINWDEVSFSINGKAQRAVHKATGIMHVNEVQPPTTIPPKSTLEDELIPAENIGYSSSNGFIRYNLLPTDASGKKKIDAAILKYKGTKITIYLPFYIAGKYESYYYDIIIDDVRTDQGVQKTSPSKSKSKKK
jgi:hypothetical protein